MKSEENALFLFLPLVIILFLALNLYARFKKLLATKSVCKM
jgi:hypothetical protein